MPTHVALLRGINVGGHASIAMSDLRDVVASLGHTDVATYIQSGNVLFTTDRSDTSALASELEAAVAQRLGVSARVHVLSRDELARVVADNPYPDETNPKALHAVVLAGEPTAADLDRVAAANEQAAARGGSEAATVVGHVLYLHLPDGIGRSKLAAQLTRTGAAGTHGTARNWATMTKLLAMCDG
ncbi:DUF1697 domain-containing protein [Phytoactinopolyspora halotolerans]|uniref:DUF1697 domain-containing protein n=1 Tax=Phytoactinopolyspora halotolerans TaxID=1981512 RepID=A0A6L9S1Z7_9ACTN|nr:DUF1697 domain-containing protein [Phytoactinopolyspora halotolerans]NED99046.1 DUF1697 domain-containing protein [Phytoactinopolyspora halotolerans]